MNSAAAQAKLQTTRKTRHDSRSHKLKRKSANISSLPREVLLIIFSYLDTSSVLTCAQVCSSWHCISQDNELWKCFYKQHILYNTTTKTHKLGSTPTVETPKELVFGYWKNMLFKKCKMIRNKRFLAMEKINAYTGIINHMDEILWKLGCKFMLCLKCKNGTEVSFTQFKRKIFDSSTVVEWSSLSEWPKVKDIIQLKIYSMTPLLFGKDKKPTFSSPVQRCLILEENFTKLENPIAITEQITLYKTDKDVMVALWSNGGEIAFVSIGLHNYRLLQKSLKSTSDKIFDIPHTVVEDDVDGMYGLHGYKCHMHLHTMRTSLWAEKFNCLYSKQSQLRSELPLEDLINFEPRGYEMHEGLKRNLSMDWGTELFKGNIPNVVMATITMCDINEDVIWAKSVPACIKTSDKSGDFKYGGEAKYLEFQDERGHFKIFLNDDERKGMSITKILLRLKLAFINDWFGTVYQIGIR